MIALTLGVLALFFVQTLIAPAMQYLGTPGERVARLRIALGPRDDPPSRSRVAERADRALRNMFEALPVFLTLALLSIVLKPGDNLSVIGAAIFLIARTLYIPAYLAGGAPGLRSAVWGVGLAGLLMMATSIAALIPKGSLSP